MSLALIPCLWIGFGVLGGLNITYASRKLFLADCEPPNTVGQKPKASFLTWLNRRSNNYYVSRILAFFLSRPFILEKRVGSIRIELYKIAAEDIRANEKALGILLLLFIAPCLGLLWSVLFFLFTIDSGVETACELGLILLAFVPLAVFFSAMTYAMWTQVLYLLFAKRVIEFTHDEVIIGSILLGRYFEELTIRQDDLLPLLKKRKKTVIPNLENAEFFIFKARQSMTLAGPLRPEAMCALFNTYECYRTSGFAVLYNKTQPVRFD